MALTEADVDEYNRLWKQGNELIRGRILLDGIPLSAFIWPWDHFKLRRAIKVFRRALEIAPQQWQCHLWIGKCHQRFGEHREAFSAFEAARLIVPDNPTVLKEAANGAMSLDRPELAIAFLRPACSSAPEDAALAHNLSLALLLVGEVDEAALRVEQSLRMQDDPTGRWLREIIREVQGGWITRPRTMDQLEALRRDGSS